jgi:hypothetical protein
VFAVPTGSGVVTIVCGTGSDAVRRACPTVASTLEVQARPVYAPPPDPGLGDDVRAALTIVARADARHGKRLDEARRAKAQAAALGGLATSYSSAVRRLAGPVPPYALRPATGLRTTLSRSAAAYRRLRDAARRIDRGAYERARREARTARARLPDRIRAFRALGYRITPPGGN